MIGRFCRYADFLTFTYSGHFQFYLFVIPVIGICCVRVASIVSVCRNDDFFAVRINTGQRDLVASTFYIFIP